MSVDATKIKVGDKVRLRNGWVHTVTEVGLQNDLTYSVEVCWLGGGYAYRYYTRDGLYWADKQDGLDIVEIIPCGNPYRCQQDQSRRQDSPAERRNPHCH